jgi:hypothetical protein
MDGGSAEKAKLEAWRQKVKEITNHKRKLRARQNAPRSLQAHDSNENHYVPVIPPSAEDAHPTPQSSPPLYADFSATLSKVRIPRWPPGRPENAIGDNGSPVLQLPTPSTSVLDQEGASESRSPPILCEAEAELLMHYLDHVFPLQFPFYKHSATKGGRGWLLSLLMQLKPLYHAALSVSSYHMHFEEYAHQYELYFGGIEDVRELPACPRLESQLTEHILTLSNMSTLVNRLDDLKRSRSQLPLREYIELIACMATLISLEVSYISIPLVVIHAQKQSIGPRRKQ